MLVSGLGKSSLREKWEAKKGNGEVIMVDRELQCMVEYFCLHLPKHTTLLFIQVHDFIRSIEGKSVDVASWYGELLAKESSMPPQASAAAAN